MQFPTSPTNCIISLPMSIYILRYCVRGRTGRLLPPLGPILAYGDPPIFFDETKTNCISPSSKELRETYIIKTNSLLRIHSGSIDRSSFIKCRGPAFFPDYQQQQLLSSALNPTHQLTQHAFNPPHKSTCCNRCHFRSFDSLYHSMFRSKPTFTPLATAFAIMMQSCTTPLLILISPVNCFRTKPDKINMYHQSRIMISTHLP